MINNKYDLGFINNFLQVFGNNPILWIFPIDRKNYLEGYSLKTIYIEDKLINSDINFNREFMNEDFSGKERIKRKKYTLNQNKNENNFESRTGLIDRSYNF